MTRLRVRVPATTANVGSGFDCVGVALDWYDELELELGDVPGLHVEVTGEGAHQVPTDERHLVVASLLAGLREWGGARPAGMVLRCHNTIPHSRGLGSSAAAIVAGLALAQAIVAPGRGLDRDELARVSSRIEGHPDNAGAAVHGGAILGWLDGEAVGIVNLGVHPELATRVWVPASEVGTAGARHVLPDDVPRRDAVAQAIRAALLPLALERRPDLLLTATADRLHQHYRAPLMQPSFDLVHRLRDAGVPAAISGAGPAVFAVGTAAQLAAADAVAADGFRSIGLRIGDGVALL